MQPHDDLENTRAAMESQLAHAQQELARAREALDTSERRRRIERELSQEGVIDLETAVLLSDAALGANPDADVRGVVLDLKRRKPFLFRFAPRSASMAPRETANPAAALESAAKHARASGDRGSLLSYLRLKRGPRN